MGGGGGGGGRGIDVERTGLARNALTTEGEARTGG